MNFMEYIKMNNKNLYEVAELLQMICVIEARDPIPGQPPELATQSESFNLAMKCREILQANGIDNIFEPKSRIIEDGELEKLDITLVKTQDLKYPPSIKGISTKIKSADPLKYFPVDNWENKLNK